MNNKENFLNRLKPIRKNFYDTVMKKFHDYLKINDGDIEEAKKYCGFENLSCMEFELTKAFTVKFLENIIEITPGRWDSADLYLDFVSFIKNTEFEEYTFKVDEDMIVGKNNRITEAIRTVPLSKQPDWVERNKKPEVKEKEYDGPSIFEDDNLDKKFGTAVRKALPHIFGNIKYGPMRVFHEYSDEWEVYQDNEIDTSDFKVSIEEKKGKFWINVVFTTAKYEDSFAVADDESSKKSSAKYVDHNDDMNVPESVLIDMIKEAYNGVKSASNACYEGLTYEGLDDDKPNSFWKFQELGRPGNIKHGVPGEYVRFTHLANYGDCTESLYNKLKAHLGKVGIVVERDPNDTDQMIVRFDDGFTFWFYDDDFEYAAQYDSAPVAVNESKNIKENDERFEHDKRVAKGLAKYEKFLKKLNISDYEYGKKDGWSDVIYFKINGVKLILTHNGDVYFNDNGYSCFHLFTIDKDTGFLQESSYFIDDPDYKQVGSKPGSEDLLYYNAAGEPFKDGPRKRKDVETSLHVGAYNKFTESRGVGEEIADQYRRLANTEREAGAVISIDRSLYHIELTSSDGTEYTFDGIDAEELLDQVPDNVEAEDFILASSIDW